MGRVGRKDPAMPGSFAFRRPCIAKHPQQGPRRSASVCQWPGGTGVVTSSLTMPTITPANTGNELFHGGHAHPTGQYDRSTPPAYPPVAGAEHGHGAYRNDRTAPTCAAMVYAPPSSSPSTTSRCWRISTRASYRAVLSSSMAWSSQGIDTYSAPAARHSAGQ